MRLWLGLDIGGTYTKAALYDEKAVEHAIARKAGDISSPHPGWVERGMDSFWRDAAAVIREVVAKAGVKPEQIAGVAIAAQGKGVYPLDKDRKTFMPGIISSDQRALDLAKKWYKDGTNAKLYALSRQNLWTGHPATILRWLKDNDAANYGRIRHVMMAHDFVRFRLTGELACEHTNISESNLFNQAEMRYDQRLADLQGIPEAIGFLGPVVGAGQVAGKVTPEAAEATGLLAGTPVAGGVFDVTATALCAALVDEEALCAVMGTWSIVTGIASAIKDHESGYPFAHGRYADAEKFLVQEASPTSAGNLEWFLGLVGGSEKLDFDKLNRDVEALGKQGSDLIFLPFLNGTNAGLGMQGGVYGLQAMHTRRHLVKAIYDGAVFSINDHIARMRLRFPTVKAIRATGGAARSKVWMQILADTTGLPVELTRFEETGCLGSALAAMVATGVFPNFTAAVKSLPKAQAVVEPDKSAYSLYQEKYRRYHGLIDAIKGFAGIE